MPGAILAFSRSNRRVAGKIALDQERPEVFDLEHPDGLRQAQLLDPVDAGDALDAAAEQRAGAVADSGEIDGVVRHEVTLDRPR